MSHSGFNSSFHPTFSVFDVKDLAILIFFLGAIGVILMSGENESPEVTVPDEPMIHVEEPPPFTIMDIRRGAFVTNDGDICAILDGGLKCTQGYRPEES